MSRTAKQEIGEHGEALAEQELKRNGYDIIENNYRTKFGEIDLVAWHAKKHFGKTLCFIEVKTRSYGRGSAERATGKKKLQRIKRAAMSYCISSNIPIESTPIQFEQVSVYLDPVTLEPSFRRFDIPID